MIRYALPLLAATAIALPASAASVQIQSTGPVIELSVTETVKGRPDIANVGAGVTSEAQTAVEAMRINAREMRSVIDRIKALGIDEDDIQTTGVNLNARYDYDRQRQQQVFRGYQASNRVSVILRDVDRVGEVLDALVAAGATNINGPSFSIDDDSAAKQQARQAALKRVEEMARDYASWSGYSGVRLLQLREGVVRGRPQPVIQMRAAAMDAAESTPVEPGLVGTAVTLMVTYEMTQ